MGVAPIVWSPPARGRLARGEATHRSATDPFADTLYTQESSDQAIVEAQFWPSWRASLG
jgi:1-deoxyxylulose-5-phosphate synthase